MSTIAVIITDLFEDVEYTKPAEAFRKAGHELIHVGLKGGTRVRGKKAGTPVKIDRAVKEVSVDDFDALLIPGGYSPDKLRVDDDAVEFVARRKPDISVLPDLIKTIEEVKSIISQS